MVAGTVVLGDIKNGVAPPMKIPKKVVRNSKVTRVDPVMRMIAKSFGGGNGSSKAQFRDASHQKEMDLRTIELKVS